MEEQIKKEGNEVKHLEDLNYYENNKKRKEFLNN